MPPSGAAGTRFVADAMLGSLARKLRAFGFDTSYYRSGGDSGIIAQAMSQSRIILTADRSLAAVAGGRGLRVVLVTGRSDGERVSAIARWAAASGIKLSPGEPLCSLCGGGLEVLSRRDVADHVPASVLDRHRLFYRCTTCGQYYWRGSHWKKLRSQARRLGES